MKYHLKKAASRAIGAVIFLSLISTGRAQTFTLSANPGALTIYPGQQDVAVTITVNSGTYSGLIGVTLTNLPSGVTCSPLTLTANSSGTLNLSASLSAGQEGFPPQYTSIPPSWTASVTVVGKAGTASATAPL